MSDRRAVDVWRARRAHADEVLDTGLQHERTALAWDRTALSLMVAGGVLAHAAGEPYLDLRHVPAYVVMGAGAFVMFWASQRYAVREDDLRGEGRAVRPRLIRVVGLVTALLAVSSLAVGVQSLVQALG